MSDKWDFLADVSWTGWSTIQQLTVKRSNGTVLESLPENFKDTWRYSAGVNYYYDDRTVLRAGVAYDQSPVNSIDRSPRLPDSDRTWVTAGYRYKFNSSLNLDLGAAYIFVKNGSINNSGNPPSIPSNGLINGSYDNHVVIVSGELNYRWR
jgi:long-chain fatty acid transport protein